MRVEHGLGGNGLIKMWTEGVHVEEAAMQQLRNVASLPFVHGHVAAMPDVHWGKGATVGSVIPTKGAIIPAAVGVDIGCGMMACRTSLTAADLPDSLHALRTALEAAIPHGRTNNGGPGDRGAWGDVPDVNAAAWGDALAADFASLVDRHPKVGRANHVAHLGTLGTGNHFVEVCLDTDQRVWVMLHSGSRGIGGRIGSYFIDLAKEEARRWFLNLPDVDLAYFPEGSEHFDDYVKAVGWAQRYAALNRALMMAAAMSAIRKTLGREFVADEVAVNCHHNYVAREIGRAHV